MSAILNNLLLNLPITSKGPQPISANDSGVSDQVAATDQANTNSSNLTRFGKLLEARGDRARKDENSAPQQQANAPATGARANNVKEPIVKITQDVAKPVVEDKTLASQDDDQLAQIAEEDSKDDTLLASLVAVTQAPVTPAPIATVIAFEPAADTTIAPALPVVPIEPTATDMDSPPIQIPPVVPAAVAPPYSADTEIQTLTDTLEKLTQELNALTNRNNFTDQAAPVVESDASEDAPPAPPVTAPSTQQVLSDLEKTLRQLLHDAIEKQKKEEIDTKDIDPKTLAHLKSVLTNLLHIVQTSMNSTQSKQAADLIADAAKIAKQLVDTKKDAPTPLPAILAKISQTVKQLQGQIKPQQPSIRPQDAQTSNLPTQVKPDTQLSRNDAITAKLDAVTAFADLLNGSDSRKKDDSQSDTSNSNPLSALTTAQEKAPASLQESAFAKLVTPSHHVPVADQVVVNIKSAIATGESTIKIQLDPANLGKVDVQLTTTPDGKTNVSVTADNRQTLEMLQRESRALEAALRDIGLKSDGGSLSFNLRQHNPQQQQQQAKGGYTQVAGIGSIDELDTTTTHTTTYRLGIQDGLDIRV